MSDNIQPGNTAGAGFNFPAIASGLTITIVLDALVQLSWKAAVAKAGEDVSIGQTFYLMLHQPLTGVLLVMFIAQFINWIVVLGKVDLSFAQPITALSYVLTCVGSVAIFGDQLPAQRIIGIALILIGVWFVSGTSHRTASGAKAAR